MNSIVRMKHAVFSDTYMSQANVGPPNTYAAIAAQNPYGVLNSFSTYPQEIDGLKPTSFTFISGHYSEHLLQRIAITRPILESVYAQDEEGAPTVPAYPSFEDSLAGVLNEMHYSKEEIISIFWNSYAVNAPSMTNVLTVDRSRLLSLFFTIDQKYNGYPIPPEAASNFTDLSELSFVWGLETESQDNPDGFPTFYPVDYHPKQYVHYDAVLDYFDIAQKAYVEGGSESEISEDGEGNQTGSGQVILDEPPDDDGIKIITKEILNQISSNIYEDCDFNYARAIDRDYEHLFGDELQSNMPTAQVSSSYNYLSPAYETVASKTNISELALPNIYSIAESSNGFDFEGFGANILNCPDTSVEQENNKPSTKRKTNIVIPACAYYQNLNFDIGGSGNQGLLPEVEPLPADLVNTVESIKHDFPWYVQIDFTGDDHHFDSISDFFGYGHFGAPGSSLSLTKISNKPLHESDIFSPDPNLISFVGSELIKDLFSSGIVTDFIKTLIYSHFAGDNLVDPPKMDPEKFALIASSPEFPNGAQIAKGIVDPQYNFFNYMIEPSTIDLWNDLDSMYRRSTEKTEYSFFKWLNTYLPDRQTSNNDSILYKNSGDISKVSTAYGNSEFVDLYNEHLSGDINYNKLVNFINNLGTALYVGNGEDSSAISLEKNNPDFLLYRSFKECTSPLQYNGNFSTPWNNLVNPMSPQQTLFYRIQKYKEGELIQNIFVPAHGAILPKSKAPDPFYRYIDTQVHYGKSYTYKISCFKLIIGTQYSYDFTPLARYSLAGSEGEKRRKRFSDVAAGYGFQPEPLQFVFHETSDGMMPTYGETIWVDKEGAVENSDDNHGTQVPLDTGRRCTMFRVISRPTLKIVEVPYFEKMTVAVLDKPPLPPIVNLYPLVGKKNDILISFENQTGDIEAIPIPIRPEDQQYFTAERVQQNRALKNDDGEYVYPALNFRSDDFPSAYEVFRLKGNKPFKYTDFADSEYKKLKVTEETSYIDKIETNTKYYYVFRTLDIHGNISNPSPLYEVEMVEDSGAVFPLIRVVDFQKEESFIYSKSFRRFLKIDASTLQAQLNEFASGIDGTSAYVPNIDPVLGPAVSIMGTFQDFKDGIKIWNKLKPYKFRIRSKKTGRMIDVNVRFKTRHTNLIDPPDNCNDNTQPGGILVKGLKDYLGADGSGEI